MTPPLGAIPAAMTYALVGPVRNSSIATGV